VASPEQIFPRPASLGGIPTKRTLKLGATHRYRHMPTRKTSRRYSRRNDREQSKTRACYLRNSIRSVSSVQ
jgi:hypothetical protein